MNLALALGEGESHWRALSEGRTLSDFYFKWIILAECRVEAGKPEGQARKKIIVVVAPPWYSLQQ